MCIKLRKQLSGGDLGNVEKLKNSQKSMGLIGADETLKDNINDNFNNDIDDSTSKFNLDDLFPVDFNISSIC